MNNRWGRFRRNLLSVVFGAMVGAAWYWMFSNANDFWQYGSPEIGPIPLFIPAACLAVQAFSGGNFARQTRFKFLPAEVALMTGGLGGVYCLLATTDRLDEFVPMLLLAVATEVSGYYFCDLRIRHRLL